LRLTALVLVTLMLSIPCAAAVVAEHVGDPPRAPWQRWKIRRDTAPDLDAYVTADPAPRPLVVFAAGSHCVPVFFYQQQGKERRFRSTLPFQDFLDRGQHRVHFAVVERRGLRSFEDLPATDLHDECTPEHGSISKEDRVRDVADVVLALEAQSWVSQVFVAGHSEGADVAAGVARALPRDVRAIGLFAGGGPSQFFDHVEQARGDGSDAAVQAVFDELLTMTGAHRPTEYRGFPAERYLSYAVRSTLLDDLRDLDLPVFIAQGTRDHNSAVASADLLAVELLRRSERAVLYLVLPGLDHGFFSLDGIDHQTVVFTRFLDWAARPDRGVESRDLGASRASPARPAPRIRYLGVDASAWRALGLGLAVLVLVAFLLRAAARRAPSA
jgi:pimeloyl-ACP methyl ester carboxylesterase